MLDTGSGRIKEKEVMRRLIVIVGLVAAGFAPVAILAQDAGPPKELVQYVRDARKAGIKDDQIQKNAVMAGWPENTVKAAMLTLATTSVETPAKPARATEDASQPAPANPEKPKNNDATGAQASFEVSGKGGVTPNEGNASSNEPGASGAAGTPAKEPAPASPAGPPPDNAAPTGVPAGGSPTITRKPDRGAPDDYVIGAGDVLNVMVWKEPDASIQSVVVRTDGRITVPLIKDVAVDGLTLRQAEQKITEQLNSFLTAPDVTVAVKEQASKRIYVIGAVKHEGPIAFTRNMDVLQALSEAGGLTDYAKKKKIYVLRKEDGREFQLKFDYDAALKGQRMEENIPLRAGDVIVVPH